MYISSNLDCRSAYSSLSDSENSSGGLEESVVILLPLSLLLLLYSGSQTNTVLPPSAVCMGHTILLLLLLYSGSQTNTALPPSAVCMGHTILLPLPQSQQRTVWFSALESCGFLNNTENTKHAKGTYRKEHNRQTHKQMNIIAICCNNSLITIN